MGEDIYKSKFGRKFALLNISKRNKVFLTQKNTGSPILQVPQTWGVCKSPGGVSTFLVTQRIMVLFVYIRNVYCA
jgi:hypothetical protein